jgi:hypothetical protein
LRIRQKIKATTFLKRARLKARTTACGLSPQLGLKFMATHKTGIIGFFDILGYQSFLENNEVGDAVKTVLDSFLTMPKQCRDHFDQILGKKDERANQILDEIESLIFSDTILLTCPYNSADDDETKLVRWLILNYQAATLQRKMFDSGLPVRGAISHGDYIIEKACFAGRPIIEAYRTCNLLDAAAVVLTKSAEDEIKRLHKIRYPDDQLSELFSNIIVEYLMPMKGFEAKRLLTVNFALLETSAFQSLDGDERKLVSECFWKHNKDIPPSAYDKLNHTEMLLRFLKRHKNVS